MSCRRLAALVLWLTLLLLTWPAGAVSARCLPPSAGDVVSALVTSKVDLGGLRLVSANIERDRLALTLTDQSGARSQVFLLDPKMADQPAAVERGRFFSYVVGRKSAAPAKLLLRIAAAFDAGFKQNPFRPCGRLRTEVQRAPDGTVIWPKPWLRWAPLVLVMFLLTIFVLPPLVNGLLGASREPRGRRYLVVLAVLLVVSGWLRWQGLLTGYAADEAANIFRLEAWTVATQDSASHPPLYRWMFNLPFAPQQAIRWGRRSAFICSLLAIVVTFVTARRLHSSWLAALVAAMVLALHPYAITRATMFRSYALWTLVAAWHIMAVTSLRSTRRTRLSTDLSVAASAAVLAQLHYFSIPLLLFEGLIAAAFIKKRRRLFWLLAPAGVLFLPLGISMLKQAGRSQDPAGVQQAIHSGLLYVFDWGGVVAVVLFVCLALWLSRLRYLGESQKLVVASITAVFAATVVASTGHFLRPPAVLFMLPFGAHCVACLAMPLAPPANVRSRGRAGLFLSLIFGVLLSRDALAQRDQQADTLVDERRLLEFVRERQKSDPASAGGSAAGSKLPWIIYPSYHRFTLSIYLLNEMWPKMPKSPRPCQERQRCFESRGEWYHGADDLSAAALGPARVLVLGRPPIGQLDDCIALADQHYDCLSRSAVSKP